LKEVTKTAQVCALEIEMKRKNLTIIAVALASLLSIGMAGAAQAQEATPSIKSQFHQLTSQRDGIYRKLHVLDRKAADLMKQGKEPVEVHAQQVALQDELDLVQLRLETMAVRYDMVLRPVPSASSNPDQKTTNAVSQAFGRGASRTKTELTSQCMLMLGSMDFGAFLRN
jgi:hypothetical protein